ncbi:hypothetical protein Patl1_35632 [Pistacia atlantica]|nr:hypothetical protein Patl1_35632 [Pistacia atlantica]
MKEEAARFQSAIKKDYYFRCTMMTYPFGGFIGKVNQGRKEPGECKSCLFKHIHFDIGYKDRVIEINVRVDPNILADLTEGPSNRRAIPQMAMAGFLPFIEVYYMFASVWGHKIYTIYIILFIIFIILLIVTAFITVELTYFQLASEDHEWWWRYVDYG